MKPELQEKLVDYLGTLEDAVKTGSDFVAEQAPLVVQEYLNWCFWEAVVWSSVGFAFVAAIAAIYRYLWFSAERWDQEQSSPDGFPQFMCRGVGGVILGAASIALSLALAIPNAMTALKITIAPRVFLLERIAELVK